MRTHLTQDEVVRAIEHQGPPRVPMTIHFWDGAGPSHERGRQIAAIQAQYPNDETYSYGRTHRTKGRKP